MFEFLLLLFGFTATGPDDIAGDPMVCDDGSAPWRAGLPNWDCELYECTPLDSLCWPERTAGCFSPTGSENGRCTLRTSTCDSRLSCFNLWVHCGGTYECHESDSWIGCTNGSCRTALLPHPGAPTHVSDVSPATEDMDGHVADVLAPKPDPAGPHRAMSFAQRERFDDPLE